MSQVFEIDRKHLDGERRLGRAIKRIIYDKTVDHTGQRFYVSRIHMEQLQRAFERTFPEADFTPTGKLIMASFRRNTRKRTR